nr:Chain C, Histone H3 peptide [Homo sapiens]5DAH_D Chain D, Histone H3 peptide [Homo sapiens]
QLATKAARKSA